MRENFKIILKIRIQCSPSRIEWKIFVRIDVNHIEIHVLESESKTVMRLKWFAYNLSNYSIGFLTTPIIFSIYIYLYQ